MGTQRERHRDPRGTPSRPPKFFVRRACIPARPAPGPCPLPERGTRRLPAWTARGLGSRSCNQCREENSGDEEAEKVRCRLNPRRRHLGAASVGAGRSIDRHLQVGVATSNESAVTHSVALHLLRVRECESPRLAAPPTCSQAGLVNAAFITWPTIFDVPFF